MRVGRRVGYRLWAKTGSRRIGFQRRLALSASIGWRGRKRPGKRSEQELGDFAGWLRLKFRFPPGWDATKGLSIKVWFRVILSGGCGKEHGISLGASFACGPQVTRRWAICPAKRHSSQASNNGSRLLKPEKVGSQVGFRDDNKKEVQMEWLDDIKLHVPDFCLSQCDQFTAVSFLQRTSGVEITAKIRWHDKILVTLTFQGVWSIRLNWASELGIGEPFIEYDIDSDSYFFHDELTRSYWRCKRIVLAGVVLEDPGS